MISESRMERYNRAYDRAASENPMTADCPPQDNADCIRDNFIEEVAEDVLQQAIVDPDNMAELVLENGYDQEGFKEMCITLSAMMDAVTNPLQGDESRFTKALDSRLVFADSMREFIEMKCTSLAEEMIDD